MAEPGGGDGYVPQPLDTSKVELVGPLADLSERLAEHVHDVWARKRLADGWVWGPERSDRDKTNPTLVRYEDLADAEKHYDRQTAEETLKAIVALGFSITPPLANTNEAIEAVLAAIRETRSTASLRRLWISRQETLWRSTDCLYCCCAEALCQQGDALLAYDVSTEGLKWFPSHQRLLQLKAWALAQTGATRAARRQLQSLADGADPLPETLGLLARTWKDCAAREADAAERRRCLEAALHYYQAGFEQSEAHGAPDFYPAINCAALQLRLGSVPAAHRWAARAIDIAAGHTDNPWAEATLAEGHLILGNSELAAPHYRRFGQLFAGRRAALASARRQARMLLEVMGDGDEQWLDRCLPLSPVIMIPSGCRALPPIDPGGAVVVCPLVDVDGAMIDSVLETGADVHILLPLPAETMAHPAMGPGQFERWSEKAGHVMIAHPGATRLTDELARYCALLQLGYARNLARTLACNVVEVEGSPLDTPCHPAYLSAIAALGGRTESAAMSRPEPVAVAFADVVGYGTLNEDEVTLFQCEVLPGLKRYLTALPTAPLFVQAWGDALYLGYASVANGGLGALALQKFFNDFPWHEKGFPRVLRLRMGLHTGPVLDLQDPFSGMRYFSGTTISRAARIEPLADEGQVFCSSAFAAAAAALGVDEFSLVYAGTHTLPKNSGYERFYRLLVGEADFS